MIGEVVTSDQVAPAVAFDSQTNSFARVKAANRFAHSTVALCAL